MPGWLFFRVCGRANFNADLGLNPVVINYFHSYSTKLANLLLMSEPIPGTGQVNTDEGTPTFQSAQPGERNVLADTAYDALIDMSKHGGAVLAKLDDQILAMNPQNWYSTDYISALFHTDILKRKQRGAQPCRAYSDRK